jgi:hypothetical protein
LVEYPFFSACQGGNLWTITSVNNGARGLYQYEVYTGKIAGPFASPELIYGSSAPIVGLDDNIWVMPDGYAVGPLGLAAYARKVQTLVPASLSVTVAFASRRTRRNLAKAFPNV